MTRNVVKQYEHRLGEIQTGLRRADSRYVVAILVLAAALIFSVVLILSGYVASHKLSYIWLLLLLSAAASSIWSYQREGKKRHRMWRLERYYRRAIRRVEGDWAQGEENGQEFLDSDHIYGRDLNVFGDGSLFELLCTVRTGLGRRGLARYLLNTPTLEETLLRQEAVRELEERLVLREDIALLGKFEFLGSKWETFEEWLDSPRFSFSRILRILAFVTSTLIACLVLSGVTALVPLLKVPVWIAPLVAFQLLVGLLYRTQVKRMLQWLNPLSAEVQVVRQGLELLQQQSLQSTKLRQAIARAQNGVQAIRKLERLLNILYERNKEWFYTPSLILLVGTQTCMAIERWRDEYGSTLRVWLDVWAEFEALNALANYAYENPDNTYPEFATDETKFEAKALGHPLLPSTSCIRNDIQLDQQSRFYIISGSNMSGKSTLLRAVGLNAVLALAGMPVRAHSLRLSRLSVCASISVVDSLLNGKSKFRAEVDRLRQMIEKGLEGVPVLFLIDEIFSGTNSRDRRLAAEAVVRTLVDLRAIGALTTHDLALTEIAGLNDLHGVNVHTGSRDGTDPMDFDYRLKPGVTEEANALAIARMAGVPI